MSSIAADAAKLGSEKLFFAKNCYEFARSNGLKGRRYRKKLKSKKGENKDSGVKSL
jgi:hypothetical protein